MYRKAVVLPITAAVLMLLPVSYAHGSQAQIAAQERANCEVVASDSTEYQSCLHTQRWIRRVVEARTYRKTGEPIAVLGGMLAMVSFGGWVIAGALVRSGGGYGVMEKGFGALFFLSAIAVSANSIYASIQAGGVWGRNWMSAHDDQPEFVIVLLSRFALICLFAYGLWRHLNGGLSSRSGPGSNAGGKPRATPPGANQSSP